MLCAVCGSVGTALGEQWLLAVGPETVKCPVDDTNQIF